MFKVCILTTLNLFDVLMNKFFGEFFFFQFKNFRKKMFLVRFVFNKTNQRKNSIFQIFEILIYLSANLSYHLLESYDTKTSKLIFSIANKWTRVQSFVETIS